MTRLRVPMRRAVGMLTSLLVGSAALAHDDPASDISRGPELRDVDLFTRPGETRTVPHER